MIRFALAESANPLGYVRAAANAGNDALAIQDAIDRSSPNYGALNTVGRKMSAEEAISDARIIANAEKSLMDTQLTGAELDLLESTQKVEDQKRFAGKVALASMLVRDSFKKPREPYKPKPMDLSYMQAEIDRLTQDLDRQGQRIEEFRQQPVVPPELQGETTARNAPFISSASISSTSPSAKELFDFYRQEGVPDAQARGLVVNAIRESSLNPTADGDAGHSIGIYQWNGPRKSLMQQTLGSGWSDWRNQARYALTEPNEPGQRFLSMNFTSPLDAANFWMTDFERPADPVRERQRNAEILSTLGF